VDAAPLPAVVDPAEPLLGLPAAALLCHLVFLFEAGQDSVQVVLLDAHLRRQLRNRDAGLPLYEGESLCGACATSFAAAGTAAPRRASGFFARGGFRRCALRFSGARARSFLP